MITPAWVAMMAAYNAEMNRRLYAAAGRLTEEERRRDRGAFWHSIHGTFSHLVWADRMWMARFAGWARPPQKLAESDRFEGDFAALAAQSRRRPMPASPPGRRSSTRRGLPPIRRGTAAPRGAISPGHACFWSRISSITRPTIAARRTPC